MTGPPALVLIWKAPAGPWEDKTASVVHREHRGGRVHVQFAGSRKVYEYGQDRVLVLNATVVLQIPPGARVRVGGVLFDASDPGDLEVREFGHPPHVWRTVAYRTQRGDRYSSRPADDVQIVPDAAGSGQARDILDYWGAIVAGRATTDPIARPFEDLRHVDPESVLATYLTGSRPPLRVTPNSLVLPFSANLSQREAIRKSLGSSLSVIEGPPGTGKTETILNLVANIVVGDLGSVGVVSLSNEAVKNVGDKLRKRGLGHMVAELGNREKREVFRAARPERNAAAAYFRDNALPAPSASELTEVDGRLARTLEAERRQSELRNQLDGWTVERRQFERHLGVGELPDLGGLSLLSKSSDRILEFVAETQLDQERGRPGLLGRIRRYFRYGPSSGIDPTDADVVLRLQDAFYDQRISELEQQLADVKRTLEAEDLDGLRDRHHALSTQAFEAALAGRYRKDPTEPVTLSTCHSLRRSIPKGRLLDYLVIDEASQVDLLTASLAMACCRNLIVVGDRRQLPHIPGPLPDGLAPPRPEYDHQHHSVLSSVTELYGDDIPVTLLREHYRSHPAIIGFCNAAFYDGELLPYTETAERTEPAMWIHSTAPGNHARRMRSGGRFNQREIEVIEQEVLNPAPGVIEAPRTVRLPAGIGAMDIAVCAPYRLQADKAADAFRDTAGTIGTVYALQGRESKVLIMTTVLSENYESRTGLRFVDDPRLVNVAVSRAKDHFVLVTNHEKLASSRNLRDLVAYIEHRYPDHQPEPSRIVSVFDLLYREYHTVLQPLAKRLHRGAGSPAERIVDVLLDDVLAEPAYARLHVTSQVLLRNLVPKPEALSYEQQAFVRRRSSVDFVVYNRVSRRPVLAIEVDGFRFHEDRPEQQARDAIKDAVLGQVGLPLLRLPTTGSGEEQRIREALARAERVPRSPTDR